MKDNKFTKDWMKLLDPEEVKFQLISSSFYITAYDILIETIVQKIKDFYLSGFDENGITLDPAYKIKVRNLNKKDIVIASALWLKNQGAITQEEVVKIKLFKDHRNELAHELSEMISDSGKRTKTELIKEIRNLRFKILKWWFIYFEMELNPELNKLSPEELDFEEVLSLNMFVINHLTNILDDEIKKRDNNKN
jgi:hypothetical protein